MNADARGLADLRNPLDAGTTQDSRWGGRRIPTNTEGNTNTSGASAERTRERSRSAAGVVTTLAPDGDAALMAAAARAVATLETDRIVYPIPVDCWGFLRASWAPEARKDLRVFVRNYERPHTREALVRAQAFRRNIARMRRKIHVAQMIAALFFLPVALVPFGVDFALQTLLVGCLITAGMFIVTVPAGPLLDAMFVQRTELKKDVITGDIVCEPELLRMARARLDASGQARLTALWTALKESAQRSGVPLLRGDLDWAIRRARRELVPALPQGHGI